MRRISALIHEIPLSLALLLAVAAVMSIAWNVSTAPLQGPDELEHVAYSARLAETGTIPSATTGASPYGADEAGALGSLQLGPLLQNPLARPVWSDSAVQEFSRFEDSLTSEQRGAGSGANGIAKNPPLYYAAQAVVWKVTPGGFFDRVFLMRLVSGLLLLATVAFTWLLAGEVFRRRLPQTVATSFVALLPMAGFLGGIVNPEIASAATWTAFLWLALRMVRLGPTPGRTALTTLAAVTAVLLHGRGLAIVPALIVVLATAWIANRSSLRALLTGAASAAAVAVTGAVTYGLVTAASGGSAYGGEANLGNTAAFSLRQLFSSIWQFYLPKLSSIDPRLGPSYGFRQLFIEQFFGGVFGSGEVTFAVHTYDLIQVLVGGLAIAFYTIIVLNWRTVAGRWPVAVIIGSTTVGLLLFLHLASYRALLGGGNDPLITGRYLLPIVAVFGLCLGAIVAGLPKRPASAVAAVLIGALFTLSVAAIGLSLERFYA